MEENLKQNHKRDGLRLAMTPHIRTIAALLCAIALPCVASVAPQSAPASLQALQGNVFLVRGLSRTPDIHVRADNPSAPAGGCDAAVQVISSEFSAGQATLRVEPIGSPQIENQQPIHCNVARQISISISGFGPHPSDDAITAAISKVLLTPEAYLASVNISEVPAHVDGDPESPLGQSSMIDFAPPRALLSVYADYTPAVRASNGSVVVQATVGRDGRIYSVALLNGLSDPVDQQVLKLFRLWRLRPAHVGDQLVAFQLNLETRFR